MTAISKLAVREINALFGKNFALRRDNLIEAQKFLNLPDEYFISHTRLGGEIIGYLGINPKIELPDLLKQLSFIQEVWLLSEIFDGEKPEFLTKTEDFICAVPFLALSEFLTYAKTEIPNLQLVRTILDVLKTETYRQSNQQVDCSP